MVKRGNDSYAVRTITGTAGEIEVADGNGFNASPVISLPDEVTKDIDFSGAIIISGGLTGDLVGNVTGDLLGNSTGTHIGPVNGDVTGNLTGNAAGDHTGSFTGDADFRTFVTVFDDASIPNSKLVDTPLLPDGFGTVPVGGIILWSGSVASIPAGWGLCDGTLTTPDLRGTFIVGAGDVGAAYLPADTGGSETHNHGVVTSASAGVHNHVLTVNGTALTTAQLPNHYHRQGLGNKSGNSGSVIYGSDSISHPTNVDMNGGDSDLNARTSTVGDGDTHTHTGSTDSVGGHTHDSTIPNANNLPPYYALAYIMRIT